MNRKARILLLAIVCSAIAPIEQRLLGMSIGTIQFPYAVQKVPHLRIYFGGNIIETSIDHSNKKLTFGVPIYQKDNLYLLITGKKIEWEAQENTITHLKISSADQYKLYKLTPHTERVKFDERVTEWKTTEAELDPHGRIPDNTIIVLFDANLISSIEKESRNGVELPHLQVSDNILTILRSEEQLHIMTESLLLSSLDSDAIHRKIRQTINQPNKKTTLIAPVT